MTTKQALVLVAAIGLAAAGCGGGSDGDNSTGGSPASSRGKVIVTVVNTIGEPVAGANVEVVRRRDDKVLVDTFYKAIADANGRAEVTDIRPGQVEAWAGHREFGSATSGEQRRVGPGESLSFDFTLPPMWGRFGGVVGATVAPGGISADGQTLEFALQIVDSSGPPSPDWDDLSRVEIEPCNPRSGNDASAFRADCVVGPEGFDASYFAMPETGLTGSEDAVRYSRVWPTAAQPGTRVPFAAALLVDQSAAYVAGDPDDKRLRAAKYFLDGAAGQEPVSLAAFAADRPVASLFSLLPSKPVSVFPVENPQFTAGGRSLFSTVDSLATMEGGAASPLAAVDRMLDFMATAAGSGRRDIVMLTNGSDETCGTRADCARLRDDVLAKARSLQVRIVTVGTGGASAPDHEMLGLLGQAAEGSAAFWATEPALLPSVLQVVRNHLGVARPSIKANVRIRSPLAGAFASGRVVTGWVKLTYCPWDCDPVVRLPFAVRIP